MDTPTNFAALHTLPQKRQQSFLRFTLEPGDEARLEQLTQGQRELVMAKGGYKELSERFNIPLGTVRSRLHRARAALIALRDSPFSENEPPVH